MIRSIKALTASSYLSMFLLGFTGTVVGAAARNIGLTPYQIGLMLAVMNVGFILAVAICGALADVREKPRLLAIGSLVLFGGLIVFFTSETFALYLLAMLLIGAGSGTYEGVSDAMLMDMHRGHESVQISVNHFFVTFGSAGITVYMIFLQMNWRNAIIQSAAVVLLLTIVFALARLAARGGNGVSYRERLAVLTRERAVVFLFLVTIFVVGVETGFIGMLTSFLMELRGFDQVTSKVGLLVFLGGVFTGRLLVGFLTPRRHIPLVITGLIGLSIVTFSVMFSTRLGALIYLPIVVAGLSLSALLPMILSAAGLLYRDISGTVLGLVKIAIPIGSIIMPLAVGLVSNHSSFEASLYVFPAAFVVAFALMLAGMPHMKITE